MVPEGSKQVHSLTIALLAVAVAGSEIAVRDGRAVVQSIGLTALFVAVAVLAARYLPPPGGPQRQPPVWVLLLLVALGATPFAVETLRRSWTGDGYPLELQMVCGLRNVGLGLAACGRWSLCRQLASVTSMFLILFAAATTNHPAVMAILGLYAATGSVWLLLAHWAGLRSVLVAPEKTVAVEVLAGGERVPWLGLSLLVLLLGGAVALVVVRPKRPAFSLGELMPTSGGTGATDPFARYGIGDGPEETAGDDPRATGMVETDKMIEDNKNSLIDALNDMYGRPHKPPKEQERMVAAGKVDIIPFHGTLPENRRPSRDFDTSRKGPQRERRPQSQKARGLFEVQGRTPLHVRLVAYERYDSDAARWSEARPKLFRPIELEGGDWMRISHRENHGWYFMEDRHRLKVADLRSNLVPMPALVTQFRIQRVDKPEYYEWEYEGVLALAGRTRTPPGVIVTTDCRTVDPRRLPESAFATVGTAGGSPPTLGAVPDAVHCKIERLAREWAGDRRRGWPQIEAVLTKLRTEYAHDRDAAAPPDHPAPVLWFLTESRRGPDYLFATAAALMLRTLGYPTRVCLGYYAAPEAYDPQTAHTPVRQTDLHFWPEVLLGDGEWLVVEPTPGYEVLGPKLPLSARILSVLAVVAAWAWRHAAQLAVLFAGLVALWVHRRELLDAVAVRLWRWWPGRTWREQVHQTLVILERRGQWAGKRRPPWQTRPCWLRSIPAQAPGNGADLERLGYLAEWATYAPDASLPWPETEVLAICHRVLDAWTLRHWRDPTLTHTTRA